MEAIRQMDRKLKSLCSDYEKAARALLEISASQEMNLKTVFAKNTQLKLDAFFLELGRKKCETQIRLLEAKPHNCGISEYQQLIAMNHHYENFEEYAEKHVEEIKRKLLMEGIITINVLGNRLNPGI